MMSVHCNILSTSKFFLLNKKFNFFKAPIFYYPYEVQINMAYKTITCFSPDLLSVIIPCPTAFTLKPNHINFITFSQTFLTQTTSSKGNVYLAPRLGWVCLNSVPPEPCAALS